MLLRSLRLSLVVVCVAALAACASKHAPTGAKREALIQEAEATITLFKDKDPDIKRFFDNSYGYAVFPTVAKGAAGVGGANGKGIVYEQGEAVGYATVSQATIGLQLGGQTYREVIFFKDRVDFVQFRQGNFEFDAQASAVAATAGASADADYDKGVAIFTMARGGLMYEASIGGQKFTFATLNEE